MKLRTVSLVVGTLFVTAEAFLHRSCKLGKADLSGHRL